VEADDVAAARFTRIVEFWNRGPVVSGNDVIKVHQLFACDPMAKRVVNFADPSPRVGVRPVKRTMFFGAGQGMVSSGSILPGETPFTDGSRLTVNGRYLQRDSPEAYVETCEDDRRAVGDVLGQLARDDRAGARRWAAALLTTCVQPYASWDPDSPTWTSLWLSGVVACCVHGVFDYCNRDEWNDHRRLRACGLSTCDQFVFNEPGRAARPRDYCSDKHKNKVNDGRRR
jgi:hypothetical protein